MMHLQNLYIPEAVVEVLTRIANKGGQAYIVGGAIRNLLLNKKVKDWDIASSLTPEQVEGLFADTRTILTGKKFGTITILLNGMPLEVTTFRGEDKYTDYRHPDEITFVSDIDSDLGRRDFTMNAIAYNPLLSDALVDPFGGTQDLKEGIIRTVRDPEARFTEDPLRILRGIRFSAQLGFSIAPETLLAMTEKAPLINKISKERIRNELDKILLGDCCFDGLMQLHKTGVLGHILPPLEYCFHCKQENPYHIYSVGMHSLYAVKNCRADLILRLAALFHDIGKPRCKTMDTKNTAHFYEHSVMGAKITQEVMNDLKYDRKTIQRVAQLVRHHETTFSPKKEKKYYQLRKLLGRLGIDDTHRLIELRRADILSQNPHMQMNRLEELDEAAGMVKEILENNDPLTMGDLALNGNDVLEEGIGQEDRMLVGKALSQAYEWVLHHPDWNRRDLLLQKLKDLYREGSSQEKKILRQAQNDGQ